MKNWTVKDLEYWDKKIQEEVQNIGLNCYTQEFEICDYEDMIGYEAYSGMPSRYPHWSFGKQFERTKTLYTYGLTGLAYEMVINSDPAIAYLMSDNSLSLQVLTMAHVMGHNDFFKNNIHFSQTRPKDTVNMFKLHSDRIRSYIEDPSIGKKKVERILDAAHAIRYQCNRSLILTYINQQKQKDKLITEMKSSTTGLDRWGNPIPTNNESVVKKRVIAPEADIMLFIRDNNKDLEDWEKDILTMIRDETSYFLPQIETKIMNEGWATFIHYTILNRLNLPQELYWDFIKNHNQVIRPIKGKPNPYYIGFKLFMKISESSGHDINITQDLFSVREVDRDASFIRRFLDYDAINDLKLFQYEKDINGKIVEYNLADEDNWKELRNFFISTIGLNNFPVVKVIDVTPNTNTMVLEHEFDGREMRLNYIEKTLEHIHSLWGNPVTLYTNIDDADVMCQYDIIDKFKVEKKSLV